VRSTINERGVKEPTSAKGKKKKELFAEGKLSVNREK